MENSIKAKTEMSSRRRDARTTDADIPAFIDSTEVSLGGGVSRTVVSTLEVEVPSVNWIVTCRGTIISHCDIWDEEACG